MKKIVLASGNKGKLTEFADMLADFNIEVVPQSTFKVTEAVEDGLSFVENAIIKARHAAKATGLPAIADDSGLEVDALHGAPGIYSARYSGEHATAVSNYQKLLMALQQQPAPRTARFQCVLVYMRHENDPTPIICQASWEGEIGDEAKGEHGHGYDPVFIPRGFRQTAAELSSDEKNQLSHRGKALKLLLEAFHQQGIID
ncbi:RdgB/HAM1 family non-canonical purine NTP pyrophosphatase [Shewanella sp. A32]|uniref:RdgB/HAM1 family non-canonical purine NTP pyrophosphatase n=1 Tax=Shewanella sp. A32 TaxID=3031327 RepID=UPI0023BA3CE0|nr:RdgB/HAM1 family non-canonical purine NTP pyrophosphatase [Shewanella sp. A32]MDF0532790.1 RdgB/HAM1 family non-canonical purine NTP pyrophosphatase [Shewanella sp. A32]